MAVYTFDCDNKIIQLTTTAELDMLDLYSRWKDEVLSAISGCDQAMRVIKEPLAGSNFVGPYYFMMNDWQIRPVDSNHELIVAGTVVQDATSSVTPFKTDDLTMLVQIVRQVAVEVQVLETGVSGVTDQDLDDFAARVPQNPLLDDDPRIDGIKERTDNLPDSPSSTQEVFGASVL